MSGADRRERRGSEDSSVVVAVSTWSRGDIRDMSCGRHIRTSPSSAPWPRNRPDSGFGSVAGGTQPSLIGAPGRRWKTAVQPLLPAPAREGADTAGKRLGSRAARWDPAESDTAEDRDSRRLRAADPLPSRALPIPVPGVPQVARCKITDAGARFSGPRRPCDPGTVPELLPLTIADAARRQEEQACEEAGQRQEANAPCRVRRSTRRHAEGRCRWRRDVRLPGRPSDRARPAC